MITTDLRFEKEGHLYLHRGRQKASVTRVLHALNLVDYSDVPEDKKEFVLFRGSWVASVIALSLKRTLDVEEPGFVKYMEAFMPYVNGALQWMQSNGLEPVDIEQPMYDEGLDLAGTPDVTVRKQQGRGKLKKWVYGIVDWKCGGVRPGTELQLAGYELLATHLPKPVFRVAVALYPNGDWSPTWYQLKDGPKHRQLFTSAVELFHHSFPMAA